MAATVTEYESATVGWRSDGVYVNPQTGSIYGANPPAGYWRVPEDKAGIAPVAATVQATQTQVNAVSGHLGTPAPVSTNSTAAAPAISNATPANNSPAPVVGFDLGSFIENNMLLIGVGVVFLMMSGGKGRH